MTSDHLRSLRVAADRAELTSEQAARMIQLYGERANSMHSGFKEVMFT
jgi:hypothetical protein